MSLTTMRHGLRSGRRLRFLVALAALVLLVWSHGKLLASIVSSSERLPQWDMAKYATSGQRLAATLANFDLAGFLAEIHALSVWPPTYPLIEVPVIWIWGLDFSVMRLLQVALWCALVFATWWAVRGFDRGGFGEAAGVTAASLVASVPIIAGLATVNMLEIPGLLLLALAFGAYGRALESEASGDWDLRHFWWRTTWLLSLALFLCKYNYGLMWLLPLAVAEARRAAGSWFGLLDRGLTVAQRLGPSRRWLKPWPLFVIGMLALILWIRFAGGIDTEILGLDIRASSPGGPAQVLYVAFVLRWILPWRLVRLRWRRLNRLPIAGRTFVRYFALLAGLWLLPPPHLKELLFFLDNRDQGPAAGTWQWLFYYPQELSNAFGSSVLAVALLVLSILGFLVWRRSKADAATQRLVGLALLLSAGAILSHPYKLPRFAVSLWWWLAVAGALGMVALLKELEGHWPRRRWADMALAAAVIFALTASLDRQAVEAEHTMRTVEEATAAALAVALREDENGEIPKTMIAGTWNKLSPHLVEWQVRRLGLADGWVTSDFDIARRRPWRLRKWLDQRPVERVVWLEKDGDAEFAAEVPWLEPVRTWLDQEGPYRLEERLEVGGYRLLFYAPSR